MTADDELEKDIAAAAEMVSDYLYESIKEQHYKVLNATGMDCRHVTMDKAMKPRSILGEPPWMTRLKMEGFSFSWQYMRPLTFEGGPYMVLSMAEKQ